MLACQLPLLSQAATASQVLDEAAWAEEAADRGSTAASTAMITADTHAITLERDVRAGDMVTPLSRRGRNSTSMRTGYRKPRSSSALTLTASMRLPQLLPECESSPRLAWQDQA